MTVKGGSRPACAACRFQRRRCSSDCALAPYFPATEPQVFQNVHSLYGVGHVMKILNQLTDDEQKEEAMTSIKYESNIRQIYKVHGCYGVLVQLHQKVTESNEELKRVLVMLNWYKKNGKRMQDLVDHDHDHDQVVVGGGSSSDWINGMINNGSGGGGGGGDLGFYYNTLNHDQTETTIDLTPNRPRFDEFQQFCTGEQDDQDHESPDYTEIICRSFVDDHDSFRGSKEAQDLKLESTVDEKLIEGVHGLTTGF